ncbi:hypothetical protein J4T90_34330 (plasmid) [Sinorhizobium medicae]|uniref:hypothetical protein n=1 Tax=Sinorhizobium medicae TaxID=110321 RepID=UPI001F211EF8|nr:hypothetical protein [Sinorhizobium medicae]
MNSKSMIGWIGAVGESPFDALAETEFKLVVGSAADRNLVRPTPAVAPSALKGDAFLTAVVLHGPAEFSDFELGSAFFR